jgi:DNA invertase Pin-like site-specific DNA recombinase
MIVGYGRTSTTDQTAGLDAQVRDLTGAGCERVWSEHVSSVATRPELVAALDFVREGDVFVVCKPDRLARSIANLTDIVAQLSKKKVTLRVLSMGLDTSTPTGKLMLNVLGSVAEFERTMMLERQAEGIAVARAAGRYKGRKPTVRLQADEIRRLLGEGLNNNQIATKLGVHRASVGRVIALGEAAAPPG